jgi:hypothetical protein
MWKYLLFFGLILTISLSLPGLGQADNETGAVQKGLEIARTSYERDSGFGDFFAEITLAQANKQGKEELRHIRVWGLERPEQGDRSISIFVYPPDVKGMARLSHSRRNEPDEHWVFIPENQRVKRLSPANQLSAFMGTQFSFEDLRLYRAEEVEKYSYRYLRNEQQAGLDCFVVERIPHKKFTNYSRQVMWIDSKEYRIFKIDFYDHENALFKTMTKSKFELYEGKFWCMREMEMVNHRTGEKTMVYWSNYRFGLGLKESDFTKDGLTRIQ